MILRNITQNLLNLVTQYPVITLTGPRQSGKTTLLRNEFPNYQYLNLENPQLRSFALNDPMGFLNTYKGKIIIDEVQYTPELFSYIQVLTDENKEMGQFILTGSQNFLISDKIVQSLAGRAAILTLLPFSNKELGKADRLLKDTHALLFQGFYPPVYDRNLEPNDWYNNYISTYLERDVRNILNIQSLDDFQRFLRVCAARNGQQINLSAMAADIGVSYNTIKTWLNVLESSFIIFRLRPFYKNFNKRLSKSAKLYFYDSGLVCALLGLTSPNQLIDHFMKGPLFESFVISEILKIKMNNVKPNNLFYWRDNVGNELDLIMEEGKTLYVYEIKSGQTIKEDFFKGFKYFDKVKHQYDTKYTVVYGGEAVQNRSLAKVIPWFEI